MIPIEEFITSQDFQRIAQHHVQSPAFDPSAVKPGEVIYSRHWAREWPQWRPSVTVPYQLISNFHDRTIEGSLAQAILDDPLLEHWYGVNAVLTHPKLTPIPFGLRQVNPLRAVQSQPKDLLCYANFRRHSPWRQQAWTWAQGQPWVTCHEWGKHALPQFLQDVARAQFVLCPPGHGPDTFRLWEVLALGAVPIICGRALGPLVDPLPVLRVDAWDEVTAPRLARFYDHVMEWGGTWDLVRREYWQALITGGERKD